MIHEKYTKKMMEIKKVGEYVDRLASIENEMCQDVDEGKLDRFVFTLLENCIDRINRVYIEGEKQYNDDCCEYSASARQETIDYQKDYDEFSKVSDVLTNNGTHQSEVV